MVQTFFPGRIVGLEPVTDDPDAEASDDEDSLDEDSVDEDSVDRPDESPDRGRDDEGPRPNG